MQLSYVNLIVLVWISCITGQTPDRYYGRGAWQVSDYMGSVWCPCLPLEKDQQERQPQVASMRAVFGLPLTEKVLVCSRTEQLISM